MFRNCKAGYGPAHRHYGAPFYGRFRGAGPFRRPKYNVPVNVVETDTFFEIHVYALGFDKANIHISVVDGLLTITGTRTIDEEQKPDFLRQEYPIKSFERVFQLSDKVDVSQISAKQEAGVLIVTLPKKPQTPEQQIQVL